MEIMSVTEQIEEAVTHWVEQRLRAPRAVALNDHNYWKLKMELAGMMHLDGHWKFDAAPLEARILKEEQLYINTSAGSLQIFRHDATEPLILLHV
jgi:hypothetical protein